MIEIYSDTDDLPEVDGPCCECGEEATHKHIDDYKNYCDECCDNLFFD